MPGEKLPESLVRLARLIGEPLGGSPVAQIPLDEAVVTLALDRHQVGPLLYAVAQRRPVAPALQQRLEASYRASAVRRKTALARLEQVSAAFGGRNIEWLALKGTTQAAQLYADPAWRDSADIDILVSPRDFVRGLETLIALGFVASDPPMPPPILRWAMLPAIRDVTLIARDDHTCAIELHQRIFLVGGRAGALRLKAGPDGLPAPAPGSELAFYLIAHGALSFWVRLKWLADLVPLFDKLDAADCLAVVKRAREAGAENSIAASLLLLQTLFPSAALEPLSAWLQSKADTPAVRRRLRIYRAMLSLGEDQRSSPLNNAWTHFKANWLLFEAPSARLRLLVAASLASAIRRFARTLSKADRALTLPR